MQQVILTVLLGPEDLTAWKRLKQREGERRRYPRYREKVIARAKKWRSDNPKQAREKQQKWRKENPEEALEQARKYRRENREKVRAAKREYDQKNRDKVLARLRVADKRKRKLDPNYRLLKNTRCRVRAALRGNYKSGHTLELIGCDILALRAHLEQQFRPGMTWENLGPVWHVDHKRPCASFDLSDPAQQRTCFHFTNLQPLWALDNLKKGAKYAP